MQRMNELPRGGLASNLVPSLTLNFALSLVLMGGLAMFAPLAHSAAEIAPRAAVALRKLPELHLSAHQAANQASSHAGAAEGTALPSQRWMLLVLDAANAESQVMLNALTKKSAGFQERIVLAVTGQPKLVSSFIARNQALQGVRWMEDQDKSLASRLNLKVMPAMYAINEKNEIVWQVLGNPKHGSVLQMTNNWLGIPTNAEKTNLAH